MTAIVAGQGLGLVNTSLGLLGNQGQLGEAAQGRSGDRVYVNAATGNVVVQQQDERLVGRGPDIGVIRTYNSLATIDGDNNDNWRLGFSRKVAGLTGTVNAAGSTIKRTNEDGSETAYTWSATSSAYVTKDGDGAFDTLTYSSGTNAWTWTDGNSRTKETYDNANGGRLTTVADPDGNALTIAYNTGGLVNLVTDANGEKTYIDYDATAGKTANITQIRTVDGASPSNTRTRVRYTYDTSNRLSTVTVDLSPADNVITDAKTYVTTYTYDGTTDRIASIAQTDGSRAEFAYDTSGRVLTVKDVRGTDIRTTSFDYSVAGQTSITDALGQITKLTYQTAAGQNNSQLLSIVAPAVGGVSQTTSLTYDADGNVTKVLDARSGTTLYAYDANGNRTFERDQAGKVTLRRYGAANELLSESVARNPVFIADPGVSIDGGTITKTAATAAWDASFRSKEGYTGNVYINFVPAQNNQALMVGLNSDPSTDTNFASIDWGLYCDASGNLYAYEAGAVVSPAIGTYVAGDRLSVTYDGTTVRYLRNGVALRSTVTTIATPLYADSSFYAAGSRISNVEFGGTTAAVWAANDNGTTIAGNTVTKSGGTENTWDAAFRSKEGFAGGAYVNFVPVQTNKYFMVGLNSDPTTNNSYTSIDWALYCTNTGTLEAYENNVQVPSLGTYAAGDTLSVTYDGTTVRYLRNGIVLRSVTAYISAPLHVDSSFYNLNAQVKDLQFGSSPASLTTRYVYDVEQHLRFVVSPEGRITENQYNSSGQLTATIQYTGGGYDMTGLTSTTSLSESQLTTRTGTLNKAKIKREDYTYDVRGQLSSKTTYDAVNTTTGAGLLDGTQSTTQYVYDQDGKLLQTIEARGVATTGVVGDYVTTYAYDGLNRLLTQTDALGNVTTTVYSDAARQTSVTAANGLVLLNTYDQAGNLLTVARSSGATALGTTTNVYDKLGRLVKSTDPTGRVSYKVYDAASRLTGDIDTEGALTEYVYNPNNQLSRTIEYANKVSATALASLDANPALAVSSVRPATSVNDRSLGNLYDAAGRLVKTIDAVGAVVEYRYDGADRLTDTIAYANLLTATQLTALAALTTEALPTNTNTIPVANTANDRRTRQFYSDDGLLLGSLDAEGYLTEYSYDSAGQRTQALRYATQTASANWATGTLATLRPAASATNDQKTTYLYNVEGQLEGTVDAEGYLTELQYDLAGNKTKQIRYATKITYTAGNGVVASRPAVNAEDQKTLWQYDALNQVTRQEEQPRGLVTTYAYDRVGNVTQTVRGLGAAGTEQRTEQRRYDALGRVVGELGARGSAALAAIASPTQAQIDDIWGRYGTLHTYDLAGRRIASVTPDAVDAVGNKTLYYYDGEGRLTHAVNALGEVTEYGYNVFGQRVSEKHYGTRIAAATLATLTGGLNTALGTTVSALANASLDSITSVGYDQRGLVTSQVDALGNANASAYNAFGQTSQRTDKIDASTTTASTFVYDRLGQLKTRTQDAGTGKLNYVTQTLYDAFGRATQVTDANGSITKRSYDRLGRAVSTTDALSLIRSATYDAFDRVLTQTDALGNVTSTVYDSTNRKFTVTTPEGITKVTVLNRHGQTVSLTDGRGNTTTYAYGSDGQLEGTTVPVVGTSSSTYDAAGHLATTVDARGTTTQYTYDAADRVLTRTVDPSGLNLKTSYSYDAIGRVATVTDASSTVTQNTYDTKGQLTQVAVDPAGLNLKTAYTYDARGKTLTVTEGAGTAQAKTTQYVYDAQGRRTKEIVDPGTGKLNLTTTYTYDADDNVVAKTDGFGNVTRYAYDANNRRVFTVDATGAVQKNEYDNEGRTVKSTAYANVISLTSPTALAVAASTGDISARIATNAADQVQRMAYDKDGRLRFSIDAANGVTELTYDKSGNVIKRTRYANAMVGSLTLGQAPAVLAAAGTAPYVVIDAAKDQTEQTVYDAANRATVDIDAAGYVTARTLDANGNVVQSTRYANTLAGTFTANTAPQFVTTAATSGSWVITSTADQTTRTVYDRANRATFTIDHEGFVSRSTYDKNGRPTQATRFVNKLAGTLSTNVEPQVVATAASSGSWVVTNAGDAATSYSYDAAGRLKTQTDAAGFITTRSYDAASRLTDVVVASGTAAAATTHYNYDAAGRVIDEIRGSGAAEASTTRYAYDGAGRVTDETLAYGKTEATTTHYDYDAANRKIKKTEGYGKAEAAVTQTAYDAFGNAVKVTDPRGNAGFFYFDALNRNTLSIDPEGYAVATQYNAFGTVDKITRYTNKAVGTLAVGSPPPVVSAATGSLYILAATATDQVTTLEHDRRNLQTKITDAEGGVETQTYDAFGNKKTFINKASGAFSYTYDRKNQLISETLPVTAPNASSVQTAVVNTYEYDARGNKTKSTEAVGLPEQRITTFAYDKLDRLTTRSGETMTAYVVATGGAGTSTASFIPTETRSYDGRGNLIEVKDPSGSRTLSYYDALNRKIAEVSPTGRLTKYVFNAAGDQTTQQIYTDAVALPATAGGTPPSPVVSTNVRETVVTYDALHRLTTTKVASVQLGNTDNLGNYTPAVADVVTTRTYDAAGNVVLETDAKGNKTYSYYDKLGRRTLKVDALRYATAWEYDASGDISKETRYANAVAGTLTLTTSLSAATVLSNVTASAANDRVSVFVYDEMNRLTTEQKLNVAVSTVDSAGVLTTATTTVSTTYTYTGLGQVATKADASGTTIFNYDKLGRQTRQQGATFTDYAGTSTARITDTEYNGLGQVARNLERGTNNAAETDDHITKFVYGKNGVMTSQIDMAGTTTYSIDKSGRVSSKSRTRLDADGVAIIDTTDYVYDLEGRQTQQIVKSTAGGVTTQLQTQETAYTLFGEIKAKGTNGGNQEYAEYDKMGRLIRTNGGSGVTKVYFYDANGNATLTVDSTGADLKSAAYSQVTLQSGANLTVSAFDARNQLTDTFSPTLTQIEHIQQAQAILNEQMSQVVNTGVTLSTAAGLGSNSAVMPAAMGMVSVSKTIAVSATLVDTYVGNANMYAFAYTSAQHTLTINKPDTSAYGTGTLRLSISLPPSAEMGLSGYYGDLTLEASAGNQTVSFNESITGGITALAGRGYSYSLFKALESGGEVYLGTFSGSAAAPTYSLNAAATVNSSSSGTSSANQILFSAPGGAGYGVDLARAVLLSRPAGSTGGWTVSQAASVPGSQAFAVDWSGWVRQDYEYRFVGIGANGNVVDLEQGVVTVSDSAPTRKSQSATSIGGDGHTFMDVVGNIHFFDQGADVTTLEVAGAGATQTLSPDAAGGPGWFVFMTAGLSGTYNYTVKAKNAAGNVVHQGAGSFTTGQANTVTEPSGVSVQTSQAVDVWAEVDRYVPVSGQLNSVWHTSSLKWGYYLDEWNSVNVSIPDTSSLGSGSVRVTASIDDVDLIPILVGGASFLSVPGSTSTVYVPNGQSSVSVDLGKRSAVVQGVGTLAHPVYYRISLFKQLADGTEISLGGYVGDQAASYSGTTVDVYGNPVVGLNQLGPLTSTGTSTFSTLAGPVTPVFVAPAGSTSEMVVQYRRTGTNDKWTVKPLATSLPGMGYVDGHFLWDTALLARGDYDFRQVALGANGSVLSTGTGVLHLQDAGYSITENADLIGGTGRAFMNTNGYLNLTEQGINAASMTVRYRPKGSAGVWSNAFTLGAGDKFRPGWFVFDPATRGMVTNTSYEYEIVSRDSTGKELNHTAGSFTVGNANSVSALQAYKGAPVIARFINVAPDTATTMRLSYRRNGTADAYTTVDVARVGLGTFDWDTSPLEVPSSQAYEFKFDALAGDGRIVARAHGVITVGDTAGATITGYTSDATPTLINFEVPDDNGVAATAMQMVLQYRKTGTTPYTALTLTRTSAAKPFVLDASSAIPPGTAGSIDYTYTLKNASNVTLVDVDGSTIQVSGQAALAAADAPDTVTTSVTDAPAVNYKIRRRQVLNAFGETIQEVDANDRVTDFAYNTLGRLIQKQDPQTSVTLANGYIKTGVRPTTKYYYDALGRLVGTDDANGNRKTMLLAAGISVGQLDDQGNAEALVFKEFHADGGVVENGYDVFGLKRFTKDELLRRTDYSYDAADRLTQVQRAARVGGTYNLKRATDSYTYDAAGNRISHSISPDNNPDGTTLYTDKTYFDALGRITKGVSAQGRTTTMTYAWDSALKGAGGAAVGGWKKTTSNGLTGSKQNAADTSTTITATVDAVNIFGQTVSHTDLGGRVYTYTYNLAGWLTAQSSTAGQSIGYEYYANGYIKKTVDNVTGAWTEYGYDKVGNRTYEAYSRMVGGLGGNRVYEQNAKISYDELNRVTRIDDLRADIRYEYDAQSNRRRVWSTYQDGVYGYESTQEYWYTYDSMNRFLVTRGKLSAARPTTETGTATIVATGVDGVKVDYDKAGQRTQAIYGLDGHREDYSYTSDGLVENTYISADAANKGVAPRAVRTNDLMGRVGAYTEYDTNGTTVTRSRTTTFDKDNRQTGQTETYKGATTTTVNTLLTDGTLDKVAATTNGTTTTTYYAYEWWDSAKQSRITTAAYNPAVNQDPKAWGKGVSHYTYDVNGHLLGAIDEQLNKSFTYVNNAQGQVMLREQRDAGTLKQTHRYYYAEGKAVGDVGNDGDTNVDYATQLAETSGTGNTYTDRQNAYKNWRPVSSADFDQNYQAITASYPGTAPGSYVVQAGDSLYSIAASQWGDASLWYLIAEANGLSGASSLTPGQTLSIPNKVTNVHNSSSTSGVYDAGKTMGDTSPTIPDAPPPPRQDKGCGALAMIIVIVVAAVVTGGVGLTLAAGSTGFAAAGAWAVAGAVGSIASQGVAMAMGVQQDFSWKAVGVSALGAAVTAGLGGAPSSGGAAATATGGSQSAFLGLNGWQAAAARAATSSVITQGVGSVLGISSFSWKGVAASAAGAGMSSALGETRWMDAVNPFDAGTDAAKIFNGTAGGMVNGGVQAGIFDTKPNWGSIAAQSFGSAVGDSLIQDKLVGDQRAGKVSGGQGLRAKAETIAAWEPQPDVGEGSALPLSMRLGSLNGGADGADYGLDSDGPARFKGDGYATVPRGATLIGLTNGDKELMGRYIAGTQLSDPNRLQAGQALVANWDIGAKEAVALANRFYAVDAQAKAAAALTRRLPPTEVPAPGYAGGGHFFDESEGMDPYSGPPSQWPRSEVDTKAMQMGRRVAEIAVAMKNDPLGTTYGGVKGVVNVAPETINLAVNTTKLSLDGYSYLFGDAGAAFRATSAWNAPVWTTNGDAELGGSIVGSLASPWAYQGAAKLGTFGYITAQDRAVSYWLTKQYPGDAAIATQVYESVVDGTRRLGFTFNGLTGYRAHNTEVMATRAGEYMSLQRPFSPADAIERNALSPLFGSSPNLATDLYQVTTRAGFYFKGQVAPQNGWYQGTPFSLRGGNTQVFMPATPNPAGGYPIAPWAPGLSKKVPYGG